MNSKICLVRILKALDNHNLNEFTLACADMTKMLNKDDAWPDVHIYLEAHDIYAAYRDCLGLLG